MRYMYPYEKVQTLHVPVLMNVNIYYNSLAHYGRFLNASMLSLVDALHKLVKK